MSIRDSMWKRTWSHLDALDCRRFNSLAVNRSSPFIYDRYRVKRSTSAVACRRRCGVIERGSFKMMKVATFSEVSFVRCKEAVDIAASCMMLRAT